MALFDCGFIPGLSYACAAAEATAYAVNGDWKNVAITVGAAALGTGVGALAKHVVKTAARQSAHLVGQTRAQIRVISKSKNKDYLRRTSSQRQAAENTTTFAAQSARRPTPIFWTPASTKIGGRYIYAY